MRNWVLVTIAVLFAFFAADFLTAEPRMPERAMGDIPFDHSQHIDSIALDCAACHTGSRLTFNAYMPSKADCMDCHRLPLTENAGIEKLDSVLKVSDDKPWSHKRILPEHVVFHHGVHDAAGVSCSDCHGKGFFQNRYGGEVFRMQSCLKCHRGESFKEKVFKPAATYCAACHR